RSVSWRHALLRRGGQKVARFHCNALPMGIVHLIGQLGVILSGADLFQQSLHLPVSIKTGAQMHGLPCEQIQAGDVPPS
ncbi:hypothetical protein, partial [Xanthomonas oryzae]